MDASARKIRWADRYPHLGRGPIPVEPCVSAEYFERERKLVFGRAWLQIARSGEVPNPGDYTVRELEVLRTSVIVVRGRDAQVRAFHNVCRHRGNRLAHGCGSGARTLRCGFHGWAYDASGALVHVPDEAEFEGFDRGAYGLTPMAAEEWEGFVFVNANVAPAESLRTFLAELAGKYDDYPFDEMDLIARYTATVDANWKVVMDISQEAYHVPVLHRRLVPDSNSSPDNPHCHMPAMRLYRRHRESSMYGNPAHKPRPAEAVAYRHGFTVLDAPAAERPLPRGLNPDRVANWAFDSNVIFPNTILHVGNGWFITHTHFPIAVDRTRWDYCFYMRPATSPGEKISQEFSKVLARDLVRGDLSAVESVQAGLASGAMTHRPLSDQEILLRHAYTVVDRWVHERD
jgi:phenylpropionate dioxygenase-like ring-hydroxylating dioxygenase large terminal subunit